MAYLQVEDEIREIHDKLDRLEHATDGNIAEIKLLTERYIPASTASISHTLSGTQQILSDLAGTVHSLACQVYDLSARITLLERVIDHDLPPEVDPL